MRVFFERTRIEPFLDQADDAPIADPVFQEPVIHFD